MGIIFLTVILLTVTVIMMWVGYVQILNHLVDRKENLKYEVLPKAKKNEIEAKPDVIEKKIKTIKWIQKGLVVQCLFFLAAVALSLIWLWNYLILYIDDRGTTQSTQSMELGGSLGMVLFILILAAFTASQIIHFIVFCYSYIRELCSE